MDGYDKWIKMAPAKAVNEELTKAIAAQIVRTNPAVRHPAADYVVTPDEVLTPERLKYFQARFSVLECCGRWSSLKGRAMVGTIQEQVERKVIESRTASVALDSIMTTLNVMEGQEAKKIHVSEGIPVLPTLRPDQVSAHKTAGLYFLVNPPPPKSQTEPQHAEGLKPTGFFVPKGKAAFREWNDAEGRFEGPFETAYMTNPTLTKIESVFLSAPPKKSMALQSQTLRMIHEVYATSKHPHHEVILKEGSRFTLQRPVVDMNWKALTIDTYWKTRQRVSMLNKVRAVYEPFFGCLLSPGLAPKVHRMANLMWTLCRTKCTGVVLASQCSLWIDVKSIAALNVSLRSTVSLEKRPAYTGRPPAGEYTYFSRALELVDVAGMKIPQVVSNAIMYSPLDVRDTAEQMMTAMAATGRDFERDPVGIVAYLDSRAFDMEKAGWGAFPFDMDRGSVIWIKGMEGIGVQTLFGMMARFVSYKAVYPFARVTWPTLCHEMVVDPVIIRNGPVNVATVIEDYLESSKKEDAVKMTMAEMEVFDETVPEVFGGEEPPVEGGEVIPNFDWMPQEEEDEATPGSAPATVQFGVGETEDDEEEFLPASTVMSEERKAQLVAEQKARLAKGKVKIEAPPPKPEAKSPVPAKEAQAPKCPDPSPTPPPKEEKPSAAPPPKTGPQKPPGTTATTAATATAANPQVQQQPAKAAPKPAAAPQGKTVAPSKAQQPSKKK